MGAQAHYPRPSARPFISEPFCRRRYHAPHLHKGEAIKDPIDEIKPRCLSSCANWLQEYNACVLRINMRTDGKGDCKGQFEELCQCQDHCIAHELMGHLK